MAQLELFFDCGSPWAHLAFHGLGPIVAETGARLSLRSIPVEGIFVDGDDLYFGQDRFEWVRLALQGKRR